MTQLVHDGDVTLLRGKAVAVLGYGNLGASMACNLRDVGIDVVIGNREDDYAHQARRDGFAVLPIAEAVQDAVLSYILLADEIVPEVWNTIVPALQPGSAVCFGSGYCVAFDLVTVPSTVDVLLLAPRMVGPEVRRRHLDGTGFFSYISVEQDASGRARDLVLSLAAAAGSLSRGAIWLTASQEAALDLFVEQSLGPYLGLAIQLAFEVAVAGGLPAEAAVLELFGSGEMAQTFESFASLGFFEAVRSHGSVAEFGGYLRTLEIDVDGLRKHFEATFEDITSGRFARTLQAEQGAGFPSLQVIAAITDGKDPMTRAEQALHRARTVPPG